MYSELQTQQVLAQYGATYVRTANGVQWWKLPSGEWVGKREVSPGLFQMNKFPANACGC